MKHGADMELKLTSLNNLSSKEINKILQEAALESNLKITSSPTDISIDDVFLDFINDLKSQT